MICGGLLRLWCYREMGDLFTFKLTLKSKHSLITTGPYAYVRHPGYTAASMFYFGIPLLHFARGSWIVEGAIMSTAYAYPVYSWLVLGSMSFMYMLRRMGVEDHYLKQKFNDEWETYRRAVPYSLLPYIY